MKGVFVDTGYWIALINPREQLHRRARSESIRSRQERTILVTSEMVLAEFAAYYADKGNYFRQSVVQAIRAIQRDPNIRLVEQSRQLFERSLERYGSRLDKSWSLTDCASFLIMEDQQIVAALAHDQHFEQAGFQALLR